jgi:carbonic anhydrase
MSSKKMTVWSTLVAGNERYLAGTSTAADRRGASRRAELTKTQAPVAMILGCADSRVPAEILFDQGLGDLFVVRTAGQALDAAVLGSVEYGVACLNVSLLVVLGHESCGAVCAAAKMADEGAIPPGWVRDVAERITPNVLRARASGANSMNDIIAQHAVYTVELLRQRSTIIDTAARRRALSVVPAFYALTDGRVSAVEPMRLALAA